MTEELSILSLLNFLRVERGKGNKDQMEQRPGQQTKPNIPLITVNTKGLNVITKDRFSVSFLKMTQLYTYETL